MNSRVRVTPEAMAEGLAQLRRGVGQLDDQLAELARGLDAMCAVWSGEAQQAYSVRRAEWTAAAQDMERALAALHDVAAGAHANYAAAERANLRMWGT